MGGPYDPSSSGKPLHYIKYDRATAESGGLPDKEDALYSSFRKQQVRPLILIQTGGNLGYAGGNNVGLRYVLSKRDWSSSNGSPSTIII